MLQATYTAAAAIVGVCMVLWSTGLMSVFMLYSVASITIASSVSAYESVRVNRGPRAGKMQVRYLLSRDKLATSRAAAAAAAAAASSFAHKDLAFPLDGTNVEPQRSREGHLQRGPVAAKDAWRRLWHFAGWCSPLPDEQMPRSPVAFVAHPTSLSSAFAHWFPTADLSRTKWKEQW
jgi:hypothetical protein